MEILREVENPKILDLFRFSNNDYIDNELFKNNFMLTGSGKAALSLILGYLRKQKILQNKMDEVVVPEWLGYWVYNQVNQYAFPSKTISNRSKALLVYHQYGFPQNMKKIQEIADKYKLIIIEDSAHNINSMYDEKLLGTFGDYTIFSFSKFFFSLALGGVKYKDENFGEYLMEKINNSSNTINTFINFSKMINEFSIKHTKIRNSSNLFLGMSYALYGHDFRASRLSKNLFYLKINKEIDIRRKRYNYFVDLFNGSSIIDHLEKENIVPYVIPIVLPVPIMKKVLNELRNSGFNTGIYKFDINRFFIEPNFVDTLWIFVHGGLCDSKFVEQINILKKYVG